MPHAERSRQANVSVCSRNFSSNSGMKEEMEKISSPAEALRKQAKSVVPGCRRPSEEGCQSGCRGQSSSRAAARTACRGEGLRRCGLLEVVQLCAKE